MLADSAAFISSVTFWMCSIRAAVSWPVVNTFVEDSKMQLLNHISDMILAELNLVS